VVKTCSLSAIRRLARQVREELVRKRGHEWTAVSREEAEEGSPLHPPTWGLCSTGSAWLGRKLKKLGCECQLVSGRFKVEGQLPFPYYASERDAAHCWLECDKYVIDLTADQFNPALRRPMPKVVIFKRDRKHASLARRYFRRRERVSFR